MSTWFYAAWAFGLVLAVVLPIAIPYGIWPRDEGRHVDPMADCGRQAKLDARQYTHPVASLWPLSASVQTCERLPDGVNLRYRAEVSARGPYGIPFASAHVSSTGGKALSPHGGQLLGLVALLSGAVLVSMPFGFLWLRHVVASRLGSRT